MLPLEGMISTAAGAGELAAGTDATSDAGGGAGAAISDAGTGAGAGDGRNAGGGATAPPLLVWALP